MKFQLCLTEFFEHLRRKTAQVWCESFFREEIRFLREDPNHFAFGKLCQRLKMTPSYGL